MSAESLQDVYADELKDLWSANDQMAKMVKVMADKASDKSLKSTLTKSVTDISKHAEAIKTLLLDADEEAEMEHCKGMEGLIEEGSGLLEEEGSPNVKDAGLIGVAQRVEHYEIAAYGTARTLAGLLGKQDAVDLLQQTLDEEKETDEKLTQLAESEINIEAEAPGTKS